VIAGVLVLAGFIVNAAVPRYEIRALNEGTTYLRIDRWAGTIVLYGLNAERPQPGWLTVYGQVR
jgi:hypothetical protein